MRGSGHLPVARPSCFHLWLCEARQARLCVLGTARPERQHSPLHISVHEESEVNIIESTSYKATGTVGPTESSSTRASQSHIHDQKRRELKSLTSEDLSQALFQRPHEYESASNSRLKSPYATTRKRQILSVILTLTHSAQSLPAWTARFTDRSQIITHIERIDLTQLE